MQWNAALVSDPSEPFARVLADALGEPWQRVAPGPSVDLCFQGPAGGLIVVELKRVANHADALGRAAMAILQIRRAAPPGARPVIGLLVPAVSDRLATSVSDYLADMAPEVGWLLLDEGGTARGELPCLGRSIHAQGAPRPARPRPAPALFTDLNRWMLKVLLHRGCPRGWFGHPTERVADATRLAAATGVSVAKAHQFVVRGVEMGLLGRRPVQLRDASRLLDTWLQAEALEARVRVPVQWALGSVGDLRPLEAYGGRWAVGGLAACEALGLRHVQVQTAVVVHVDDAEDVCRACDGVVVDDERDAHLVLLPARHPESVFRGRVGAAGGWHVDAWQSALDTVGLRGGEQAEFIRDRILAARHDD